MRLPHAFVGALCLGFALANVGRLTPIYGLVGAGLLGALALVASDARVRWALLASALVALAWAWGSLRLSELDRSALASRIGTAEQAVVEVAEPPHPGSFDERMKAVVLRWGSLRCTSPSCSSSRSAERRRRVRFSGWSASCGLRPDRRTASTRRRGCAGRGSMRSCVGSRGGSSDAVAASPASATASAAGSAATRRPVLRASDAT